MNQCDGCKLHMPIKNGLHYQGGHPYMSCTKDRYPDRDTDSVLQRIAEETRRDMERIRRGIDLDIPPLDYELPKAERRPDPGVQFAGLVFISIFLILIGIFIGLLIA